MIFFLYIKILNINFNYFTMDKNIKDYITDMYNFLYDLHTDDPGTCMTGNELLSKMVSSQYSLSELMVQEFHPPSQ